MQYYGNARGKEPRGLAVRNGELEQPKSCFRRFTPYRGKVYAALFDDVALPKNAGHTSASTRAVPFIADETTAPICSFQLFADVLLEGHEPVAYFFPCNHVRIPGQISTKAFNVQKFSPITLAAGL